MTNPLTMKSWSPYVVGAAIGVALVVAIQTSSEGITGFRNGWWFSAACAFMVALLAFGMPSKSSAALRKTASFSLRPLS